MFNKLEVVSTDFANRNSTTGAVNVTYVVCEPVQFGVDGPGKITPAPASCYEIGKTYTVTAVPTAGCVFEGWSGSTNSPNRVLKFQMRSGLAFTAKFRDATKPTITVTKSSVETTNSDYTISGKATDNVAVANVFWSANGGQWNETVGTTAWNMIIPLEPGPNRIRVYSQDGTGNVSPTREISIMSVRELARVYFPLHAGDQWTYLGSLGRISKQVFSRDDGTLNLKDMQAQISETYYKYNADYSQVLNQGGAFDLSQISLIPPLTELDQKNLAHGGASTIQTMALVRDPTFPMPEIAVQMKFVLKISVVSQVTVPAGVYRDCRRLDLSVWGYIPGKGWNNVSKGAYIMAPNVGPIQNGLFRKLSNGTYQFGGWENLEHATIDGNPIGLSPAAALQVTGNSSASTIRVPDLSSSSVVINSNVGETFQESPVQISEPVVVVVPQDVKPSEFIVLEVAEVMEDGFEFLFPTQLGRNYRVQASYDLVNWGDLIPAFTAQADEYRFTDPETSEAFRFYRVIAE